jgi:hypothetical protein
MQSVKEAKESNVKRVGVCNNRYISMCRITYKPLVMAWALHKTAQSHGSDLHK